MVVTVPESEKPGKAAGHHVRPDLIGKVVEFDGDRFVIDFTRPQAVRPALAESRRR